MLFRVIQKPKFLVCIVEKHFNNLSQISRCLTPVRNICDWTSDKGNKSSWEQNCQSSTGARFSTCKSQPSSLICWNALCGLLILIFCPKISLQDKTLQRSQERQASRGGWSEVLGLPHPPKNDLCDHGNNGRLMGAVMLRLCGVLDQNMSQTFSEDLKKSSQTMWI